MSRLTPVVRARRAGLETAAASAHRSALVHSVFIHHGSRWAARPVAWQLHRMVAERGEARETRRRVETREGVERGHVGEVEAAGGSACCHLVVDRKVSVAACVRARWGNVRRIKHIGVDKDQLHERLA